MDPTYTEPSNGDQQPNAVPLRAAATAAYQPRPAPEPSRKLFQDATQLENFQFPSQFAAPVADVAPPPNDVVPAPAPAEAPLEQPTRQVTALAPRQLAPSQVLHRQAVTAPTQFVQLAAEPVPLTTPLQQQPFTRTFEPPQTQSARRNRNLAARLKQTWRQSTLHQRALGGVTAAFVLAAGLSATGLHSASLSSASTNTAALAAAVAATTTTATTPASTQVVSLSALHGYKVAASEPRYISIPKFNVLARVAKMPATADNALASPSNVNDAAWDPTSAQPGSLGATLLDGHTASNATAGVFANLKQLVPGDTIELYRGDSTHLVYTVVKIVSAPSSQLSSTALRQSIKPGVAGLNLITCADNDNSALGEQTVVYATLTQ